MCSLTGDKNIRFQQNLSGFQIGIVVNQWV